MPCVTSCNGKWSGEGNNYVIYRPSNLRTIRRLGLLSETNDPIDASWDHRFSNGWVACVTGKLLRRNEKKQKSDGFSGYDWMVTSILQWGEIRVTTYKGN